MGGAQRYQDRFISSLDHSLSAKGFSKADGKGIASVLAEKGYKGQPLVYPNEEIYIKNRGDLRPIFAVFVKRDLGDDSVTVLSSDPSEGVAGAALGPQAQYLRRSFSSSNSSDAEGTAHALSSALSSLSDRKGLHRMQVHFHARKMLDGSLAHDDGWSAMDSVIRRALLHHVDFLCYTPHNSFEFENHALASLILSEFGVVFPLACEITMPLLPDHPNGPHHIVIAGTPDAAEEIDLSILRTDRSDIRMPSYYLGSTLDEMYSILQPMRRSGSLIMGPAHAMNNSERALPINGIGLFSAVQLGLLTLGEAMDLAAQNDFYECWNDSIYGGEMSWRSGELESEMENLLAKHGPALGLPGDIRLSANLSNLLLAAELEERFKIGQSFGTDNHVEAPLDMSYLVGGDPFARGWTTIDIPDGAAPADRKLAPEELVRGISEKSMAVGAVLFTSVEDDLIKIVDSRTMRQKPLERIVRKMARKQYAAYVHDLARDLFGFIAEGEFENVGNMGR